MQYDPAELDVLISEDLAPFFWRPDLLDKPNAWFGHIPFAHWLIATSVPRVVVELGCQAGHYPDQIFEEKSVDILHIDGLHSYDAVKHDFLSWESKLSDRAVVLFHDINERREGFGVWRFWAEIRQHHPSFEFLHSHGLGVLAVGKAAPDAVLALCGVGEGKAAVIRDRFQKLGSPWVLEAQLGRERINNEAQRRKIIAEKSFAVKQVREELEPVIQEHLKAADEMKQQISVLNDQLNEQVRLIEVAKHQAVSVEDELKAQIKAKEVEASMALGRLADAQVLIATLEREKSAMLSSTPWRVGQSLHSLAKRMPNSVQRGLVSVGIDALYRYARHDKAQECNRIPNHVPITVAVCFHIYYSDVALEIVGFLEKISFDYTVFVTYDADLSPLVKDGLLRLGRKVYFIKTDNLGRDVKPFLECLRHPEIKKFELILKIHTKRGKTQIGNFWREFILKTIIGNSVNFNDIAREFQNDGELMLAGPKEVYISAKRFMYKNQYNVQKISDTLLNGFLPEDWGFFAGTMFWARRSLFDPLLNCEAFNISFDDEKGSSDGELEHAFERIFGLLPLHSGGKILLLGEEINGHREMTVLVDAGSPSQVPVTQTMKRLKGA